MAYVEAKIVVAMILQKFKVIVSPGSSFSALCAPFISNTCVSGQTGDYGVSLTLPKLNGLKVRVQRL